MESAKSSLDTFSNCVLNTENHLRCISNKQAVLMCVNKKCTSMNLFQCFDESCKCQEIHINCFKASYKPVTSMIKEKLSISVPLKQAISSMITKMIDELSLLEEALHLKLDKQLSQGQLSGLEQEFQSLMKGQRNFESFSPLSAEKIWIMATEQIKPPNGTVEYLNVDLKCYQEEILNSNANLTKKVNKLVRMIALESVPREIMMQSAICTSQYLSKTLVNMFSKKILTIDYLYRASSNNFCLQKYYQICGKVPNTLFVCKTNMDKIIGAYTPLLLDQEPSGNYIPDPSGETFLFSLTDNQKFNLVDKVNSKAIYRYRDKCKINFGAAEFKLNDKSNQYQDCISYVNKSNFYCPAYSVNDKAAYLKFHGNECEYFATKQWQVWKVEFIQK